MTELLHTDGERPVEPTGRRCRIPMAAHVAALTLVLLGVMLFVGTDVSFSSDEGAAILQAQSLSSGQGWIAPNPFPDIDPTGEMSFVALSVHGTNGTAVFAKHFTYPLVLSLAERTGGVTAMVMLSVVAALGAAWVTARIARRLDPRLERWALWAAGVGSPMLFDSQLVIAHTIGAALVGAVILALLEARDQWRYPLIMVVWSGLFIAALQRNEAILFAIVVAIAVGFDARRRGSWRWAVVAAGCVGAVGAAAILDRWAVSRIVGGPVAIPVPVTDTGFLSGRVGSLVSMAVLPGDSWPQLGIIGLLVMAMSIVTAAMVARASDYRSDVFRLACGGAVVGIVLVFAGRRPDTIPSLLLACPVLLAGLVSFRRRVVRNGPAQFLGVVGGGFVLAVAVLQYSQAGAAEWGARFVAIALPVLIPLALLALLQVGQRLPPVDAKVALAALTVVSVGMGAVAAWSLRYYHNNTRAYVRVLDDAANGWTASGAAGIVDGEPSPVVVTTWIGMGRLYWPSDVKVRGMTVAPDDLEHVLRDLQRQGIDRVTLVSISAPEEVKLIDDEWEIVASYPEGRTTLGPALRLQARGP